MARPAESGVAGKLVSLGTVLLESGPIIEADLQQFYGVNLLDLSPRRAWVLISNLPAEARWVRELQPETQWNSEAYLLASVVDQLAQLTWLYAATHSKKKPPQPKPVPRPGQKERAVSKYRGGRLASGEDLLAGS